MNSKKSTNNTNCCVPQCHSKASRDSHLSFHRFPHEGKKICMLYGLYGAKIYVDARREWIRLLKIGKEISNTMVVCSKHFRSEDFTVRAPDIICVNKRLKRSALPSLFLPDLSSDNKETIQKKKAAAIKRVGRQNKLKKESKNAKKLPEPSNCFARDIRKEIKLPAIQNLEMLHMTLKSEVDSVVNTVNSFDRTENIDLNIMKEENVPPVKEYFTYHKLLENLLLIKKPNYWWSISCIDDFIICARWNNKYIIEKRVVIENNLIIRVFLKELEVNVTDFMDITCIDDISTLLQKVESYI